MKTKGFTLIELLVVIVIIGILVAIALPNFIKIKDKAKEAEVKQNLHAIQLAIERYATDMDGNYPYFLYGGDARYNIGTINALGAGEGRNWGGDPIQHAFDMFWLTTIPDDPWDYDGDENFRLTMGGGVGQMEQANLPAAFGDAVAYEGYMPKFPKNPFLTTPGGARPYSYKQVEQGWNLPEWACWGGRDGKEMFNTGYYGCYNMIIKYDQRSEEDDVMLELPGQFYYHPRWSDGVTNYGHFKYQELYNAEHSGAFFVFQDNASPLPFDMPDADRYDVASLDVAGYDLIAYGSARTKGQDMDNSVTVLGAFGGPLHRNRTGYVTLGQERNPYIEEGDPRFPNVGDYDERPFSDSIADFYIIHLSSGMDKKPSTSVVDS